MKKGFVNTSIIKEQSLAEPVIISVLNITNPKQSPFMYSILKNWRRSFFYLLLLLLNVVSLHTFAQSSKLQEDSFEALFSTQEEFLHVDEAYQLSLRKNENGLLAEWVIADKYFLYGEQFRIHSEGKKIAFEKANGEVSFDKFFKRDVEKHYTYIDIPIAQDQLPKKESYTLSITYQGCADAGLCYPPETKVFSVTTDTITEITQAQKTAKPANNSSPLQMLFMVLLAITGGVILNLMPCVFPVLSLKALSFANAKDKKSQILHGWAYTLGCISTFIVIAVCLLLARSAGQAVGWGFQLQSPAVITFLALLFFVMALSLSGLIHFGTSLMSTGQNLAQGTQLRHSFFTGTLASVVASPCTAPFMATALGYALTQNSPTALLIFASLGFGMAIPFLLLSYLPQLHTRLPAPGAWMETFKQALAFPLYLTSIWLLWVLGQQIGNSAIALLLVTATTIAFLFWLQGKKPQWSKMLSLLALILVVIVTWNNQQQPANNAHSDRFWQPYSKNRLSELRSRGEPVFVNLTADWCITCKFNEKVVFTEETLQYMQDKGIHLIEGDWTNYNDEITSLLEEYGRGGVPLYLLFPTKINAKAAILPQILSPSGFKNKIDAI